MTLTTTETQFLTLVRAAVTGTECPVPDADWRAVFQLAAQQKLLPLVFSAARHMPVQGETAALFAAARQQAVRQVLGQSVRSAEFAALYRQLRVAGLHPMVVKGQLCSRLYPLPDHRISADDDLLLPDREFSACHRVLLDHGLRTACPDDDLAAADEVTYTKDGSPLYLEVHRNLFPADEALHGPLNGFFRDIPPVETDGFLTLPPHEHLLYLLLHAWKHFISRGVGLRQFCDIGLWAGTYFREIDWPLLYRQCESVHAAVFAGTVFRIARETLSLMPEPPAPWDCAADPVPMLRDTFCGGIYGSSSCTRLHSSTVTLNAVAASRTGRKSSLLTSVFPPKTYLESRYPYLKRRPYLLPAAWVQRLWHYAAEKQSGGDNSASGSVRLARERIALMKQYGIMD